MFYASSTDSKVWEPLGENTSHSRGRDEATSNGCQSRVPRREKCAWPRDQNQGGCAGGGVQFSSAVGAARFYLSALRVQPAWLPSAKSLLFLFCIKPLLSICLFLSRERERERVENSRFRRWVFSSPALFPLVIVEYRERFLHRPQDAAS